jgi:stage II sporulation protein D
MHLRRTHLVLALVAALAAPVSASAATTFTISGHGYGHGVGMGQYGAQGYALQGWTHQQILAHYYQGTTLGPSGVSQVRVLLQEKLPVAIASAPAGVIAADEGGSASLAVPGPDVKVRKDPGGFTLLDASGTALARGWVGPVSLTATGGGPIALGGPALNFLSDGRYRGRLRVLGDAGGLSVVNVVTLESYLLGVVASEMPSDWKPEALETQAIAARTYAIATRKPAASPFDLYPDERSQVYRGLAAEKPSATAAIQATAGQVVLYQGQPIITYFSSSTGGRSAAAQEVFPAKPVPYLVSVADPFDTISPYHDWTLELSARELSQKTSYPGLVSGVQVDAFPSGRVNTITLNGDAGPLALSATLARKRLGLRSTWFTVSPAAPAPPASPKIALRARVASNRVLLSGKAPPGSVTLQGRAGAGWRNIITRPVTDAGQISFRRPVGEAKRYRLVVGSLSSVVVPVLRPSGVLLRGRKGARLRGRLYPRGARGVVVLQHVIGGRWTWVASATTRRDGSFRLPVRAQPGRWRVRWRLPGLALARVAPQCPEPGLDADGSAGRARVESGGRERVRLRRHASGVR